ncbi:MAG: CGNR zinc finger domain-containing protein [Proteobacteria bacterium]|nr:CGNR zinc finger domain-containing protein [Pseudomonadota bacterium]
MLIPAIREDLCLNYANTLSWRGSETPAETLHDLADLLGWIERSAGMGAGAAREIRQWSRDRHRKAAKLFAAAIAMREAIFRIFAAVAVGEPIGDQDFVALQTALAEAPARSRLARVDSRYAWRIEHLRPSVPGLLAPVLWSAGDLVLNAGHRRIRQCANEKCLWLFLDESKSGTRRWCDMTSCGNRAKARRHYSKMMQR